MFEINYSQLIQYEILEKLVTCIYYLVTLTLSIRLLCDVTRIWGFFSNLHSPKKPWLTRYIAGKCASFSRKYTETTPSLQAKLVCCSDGSAVNSHHIPTQKAKAVSSNLAGSNETQWSSLIAWTYWCQPSYPIHKIRKSPCSFLTSHCNPIFQAGACSCLLLCWACHESAYFIIFYLR